MQLLIQKWHKRANEQAIIAGRLASTTGGLAAASAAEAIQECTRELITVLVPPMRSSDDLPKQEPDDSHETERGD